MKNWYKSRTIRIAIVQGVLGIILAFAGEFPGTGWASAGLIAKSLGDIIIRIDTTEPLK